MRQEEGRTAHRRTRLLLRLALLAALLLSGFVLVRYTHLGELLEKERMVALFESLAGEWWTPLLLVASFCGAAPLGLPASPFLVAGGVVFGFVLGSVYNILGLLLGAMIGFGVAKALGREAIVQLAGPKLRRAEILFEKRGFWPLVQVRFLPIPFSVVGYAAALAGVSAGRYLLTSALGLVPATVLHTYYAPKLLLAMIDGSMFEGGFPYPNAPFELLVPYALLLLALNGVAGWPQIRSTLRRRRRYRELVEERRRRQLDRRPDRSVDD